MIILTDSCPVCNSKDIEIKTVEYDFPEIGKSLLYIFKCNSCNYKTFEIIPLEDRGYIRIEYKIDNIEKARKLFLRSPYAKIILKEIEIEITPGIESKFEIRAIDDFLINIKNNLESFKILYSDDKEKYNKIIEKINYIEDVLNNKKELTIIIEDEKGLSKIY
jgi:zinc finger protein